MFYRLLANAGTDILWRSARLMQFNFLRRLLESFLFFFVFCICNLFILFITGKYQVLCAQFTTCLPSWTALNYELSFSLSKRLFGWMAEHFSMRSVLGVGWWRWAAHWRLISALFRGFVFFPWPIQPVGWGLEKSLLILDCHCRPEIKTKAPLYSYYSLCVCAV